MTYPSMIVSLAFVLALLPFLPGDPLGGRLFVGGIFVYAAGATWMRWKIRDPNEWRERNLVIHTASGGPTPKSDSVPAARHDGGRPQRDNTGRSNSPSQRRRVWLASSRTEPP